MTAYENALDKVISERTQARADLFRAQERIRELEDMLAELGAAELKRRAALERGDPDPYLYYRSIEDRIAAVLSMSVDIATKRREGK